jgi:hypothetical protein
MEGELREPLPKRTIGGHSLGVAELRPPSSPSLILLRFPPKLFPIDGIRREDYRIVGETEMEASRNPFSAASLA